MESRNRLTNLLKQKYPKNVYIEIFSMLKDENHTVNNNGIFFNLSDITDDKIEKCINYIECITNNVEDHFKNLSIREDIESKYKTDISKKKIEPKTKTSKREPDIPEITTKRKEYSGVYKRIDRILRGLKPEEKKNEKKKDVDEDNEEEISDTMEQIEEELDDDNLFGESDSDSDSEI